MTEQPPRRHWPPANDAPPMRVALTPVTIYYAYCPACQRMLYSGPLERRDWHYLWFTDDLTGERTCPACGQRVTLAVPGEEG